MESLMGSRGRELDGYGSKGDVLSDTHRTLVQASSRLIAAVGVNDLMIVEAADTALVSTNDKSQETKIIVSQLEARNATSTMLTGRSTGLWAGKI